MKRISKSKQCLTRQYVLIACICSFFCILQSTAQTPEQLDRIRQETNVVELQGLSAKFQKRAEIERALALEAAKNNGWPVKGDLENGGKFELIRLDQNGDPLYYHTHNAVSAESIGTDELHQGGNLGLNLTGNGIIIGEWDEDAVRNSHEQFNGRVSVIDGTINTSNHATHVCGTLIGNGNGNSSAKGMASQARVHSYTWVSDVAEMASFAANGHLVSNHSYGLLAGWHYRSQYGWDWSGNLNYGGNESHRFGLYNADARDWDDIAYNAPYYLIVKSVGNDRNQDGPPAGTAHTHNSGGSYTDTHPPDGQYNGFDCISTEANAKNILTVGAVEDINGGYSNPSHVQVTDFSAFGPTDDGRIKPDIVANGNSLTSSMTASNDAYGEMSGTSMASPSVAGSCVLLQEHYSNTHGGQFMKAATLKALVIGTADEAGRNGPDYEYGWGLMNSVKAAELVTADVTNQDHISERVLQNGGSISISFSATNAQPLIATICWTDPPGTSSSALNSSSLKLVNDLDMRLTHSSSATYLPYVLNPSNPSGNVTFGDNFRDNVEQIRVEIPPAGNYTLTINHKGSLQGGSQAVSIVISGLEEPCDLNIQSVAATDPECAGENSGSISINASSSHTPMRYSVNGGANFQSSSQFNSLSAGTYNVAVKDDRDCQLQQVVQITDPQPINLSLSSSAPSCTGVNDGSIQASASGGTGTRQFSINGSGYQSSGSFSGLSAGSYTITARDANGCRQSRSITLSNSTSLSVSYQSTSVTCFGANDGSVQIFVTGGTQPYLYALNNGQFVSSNLFSGLSAGNYQVAIQDANGCVSTENITITQPAELNISANVQDVSQYGLADGSISLHVTGGTPPFTYNWSNGFNATSNAQLSAGNYNVTVTDANSCEATAMYAVAEPSDPLSVQLGISDVACQGEHSGIVEASVSGGVPPYTYLWSNGQSGSMLTNVSANAYSLTVTDQAGATISATGAVSEPSALVVSLDTIQNFYPASLDGAMSAQVAGGVPPYTFIWSNGQSAASIDGLSSGEYVVTVTDANLCAKTESALITHTCDTQEIRIPQGWSIVSSFIEPDDPDLLSVFDEISAEIQVVKDQNGIVALPIIQFNDIGVWNVRQAYKLKARSATLLTMGCSAVEPANTRIDLPAGWSFLPYLLDYPLAPEQALADILSDIMVLKDAEGKVFAPLINVNQIGNLKPGKGYKIKMRQSRSLNY